VRGREDEQLLRLGDLASHGIGCMALALPSEVGRPHVCMAVRSSSAGSGEGSGEGGVWRRWWGKGSSWHGVLGGLDVICRRNRARRCHEKASSSDGTGWRTGGAGVQHPGQRLGSVRVQESRIRAQGRRARSRAQGRRARASGGRAPAPRGFAPAPRGAAPKGRAPAPRGAAPRGGAPAPKLRGAAPMGGAPVPRGAAPRGSAPAPRVPASS